MRHLLLMILTGGMLLSTTSVNAGGLCDSVQRKWPEFALPESALTAEAVTEAIQRIEVGIEKMHEAEYFMLAKKIVGYGLLKQAEVSEADSYKRSKYCEWLGDEWYASE